MRDPSPDAWAQIRYAYEHTDTPVEDICLAHGISSGTLRDRVRRWGWTRRRPPIPREGPPAVAVAAYADNFLHPPLEGEGRRFERQRKPSGWGEAGEFAEHPTPPAFAYASASDPPPPGEGEEVPIDPAAIVPRLQSAVARVLPAIEATIARLAAGPFHPREMEQAGRALSSLTRTLRELNALLAQQQARAADDDFSPRDIEEIRSELAQRLHALIDAEQDKQEEAKPEET
jgi:hypothetical protein